MSCFSVRRFKSDSNLSLGAPVGKVVVRDTAERIAILQRSLLDVKDAGRVGEFAMMADGAFSVSVTPGGAVRLLTNRCRLWYCSFTTPIASPVGSRPPSVAVSVFVREKRLITNVYIDGFNLYYRALKDTPFRWLDLRKLAETLFPQDNIHRVCYFTARLDARPGNPNQPRRQLIYLRALSMLPRFEVYYGAFRSGIKRRPLAEPMPGLPTHVLVRTPRRRGRT